MQPYDLIVNWLRPRRAASRHSRSKSRERVGVIEKQSSIEGVCINTGTIPSKTMREAVPHLSGLYDKNFYGTNRLS
ncbi:MAG TPA: hypothetical protein VIX11_03525 [Candidatus Acidoferrum sp.]